MELVPRKLEDFQQPNLPPELAQIQWQHYEQTRARKLHSMMQMVQSLQESPRPRSARESSRVRMAQQKSRRALEGHAAELVRIVAHRNQQLSQDREANWRDQQLAEERSDHQRQAAEERKAIFDSIQQRHQQELEQAKQRREEEGMIRQFREQQLWTNMKGREEAQRRRCRHLQMKAQQTAQQTASRFQNAVTNQSRLEAQTVEKWHKVSDLKAQVESTHAVRQAILKDRREQKKERAEQRRQMTKSRGEQYLGYQVGTIEHRLKKKYEKIKKYADARKERPQPQPDPQWVEVVERGAQMEEERRQRGIDSILDKESRFQTQSERRRHLISLNVARLALANLEKAKVAERAKRAEVFRSEILRDRIRKSEEHQAAIENEVQSCWEAVRVNQNRLQMHKTKVRARTDLIHMHAIPGLPEQPLHGPVSPASPQSSQCRLSAALVPTPPTALVPARLSPDGPEGFEFFLDSDTPAAPVSTPAAPIRPAIAAPVHAPPDHVLSPRSVSTVEPATPCPAESPSEVAPATPNFVDPTQRPSSTVLEAGQPPDTSLTLAPTPESKSSAPNPIPTPDPKPSASDPIPTPDPTPSAPDLANPQRASDPSRTATPDPPSVPPGGQGLHQASPRPPLPLDADLVLAPPPGLSQPFNVVPPDPTTPTSATSTGTAPARDPALTPTRNPSPQHSNPDPALDSSSDASPQAPVRPNPKPAPDADSSVDVSAEAEAYSAHFEPQDVSGGSPRPTTLEKTLATLADYEESYSEDDTDATASGATSGDDQRAFSMLLRDQVPTQAKAEAEADSDSEAEMDSNNAEAENAATYSGDDSDWGTDDDVPPDAGLMSATASKVAG
uniref:Uncharacterized protein n=1 Tax=Eutreptiella gymnastica TaxID=73025 RepID=A0A7S1IZM6_9EUGL